MALDQTRANEILTWMHGGAAPTILTSGTKLAINTVVGTATAASTEVVTGGRYTAAPAAGWCSPGVLRRRGHASADKNAIASVTNYPRVETSERRSTSSRAAGRSGASSESALTRSRRRWPPRTRCRSRRARSPPRWPELACSTLHPHPALAEGGEVVAITDLGLLGTGSSKTAATTLAVVASTTIPAGTLVHVTGCWDGNTTVTTAPTITLLDHRRRHRRRQTTAAPRSAQGSPPPRRGVWHQSFRALTTRSISSGATICTLTSNQSAAVAGRARRRLGRGHHHPARHRRDRHLDHRVAVGRDRRHRLGRWRPGDRVGQLRELSSDDRRRRHPERHLGRDPRDVHHRRRYGDQLRHRHPGQDRHRDRESRPTTRPAGSATRSRASTRWSRPSRRWSPRPPTASPLTAPRPEPPRSPPSRPPRPSSTCRAETSTSGSRVRLQETAGGVHPGDRRLGAAVGEGTARAPGRPSTRPSTATTRPTSTGSRSVNTLNIAGPVVRGQQAAGWPRRASG